MMECTVTHGPCSWKAPPEPPPCPPPPKKPFPWQYPAALIALLTAIGLLYQYYNYNQSRKIATQKRWQPRAFNKSPWFPTDLPECVQYLIIGTGPAGWAAFQRIRKEDPQSLVFFISDEDTLPYKKYPMSRWMWWRSNPPTIEDLNFIGNNVGQSMYESKCEKFVDPLKFAKKETGPSQSMALGWEVLYLNSDEHVVWIKTVCGDRPMYYERCLIATGATPKTLSILHTAPRSVRNRVTTFRTLRDLEKAYEMVSKSKHVTIIGGGVLGVELAWFISRMHKNWIIKPAPDYEPVKITLLSKDMGVLSNILPSYLADWCSERLRSCNVDVLCNKQVHDIYDSKDERLQLTLSDGSNIVTDFAFVCIGTTPRDEIGHRSELEVDPIHGGFVANTECQIRKHLYTAGDVASVYCPWKGTRVRYDHLENAIETGSIAGANMTGMWEACNSEPYFTLDLGPTINLEAIGDIGGCMPTIGLYRPCEGEDSSDIDHLTEVEQAERCNKKDHEYMNRFKHGIIFYFRERVIVGIVLWNITNKIENRKEVAVKILRSKPTYEDINSLAEQLGVFNQTCAVSKSKQPPPEVCTTVNPKCIRNPLVVVKVKEQICYDLESASDNEEFKASQSEAN